MPDPEETEREALATLLDAVSDGLWDADNARGMAIELLEYERTVSPLDGKIVGHWMWAMGAWLKHPKCPNNPRRGGDANYENGCGVCLAHLEMVGNVIVAALAAGRLSESDPTIHSELIVGLSESEIRREWGVRDEEGTPIRCGFSEASAADYHRRFPDSTLWSRAVGEWTKEADRG